MIRTKTLTNKTGYVTIISLQNSLLNGHSGQIILMLFCGWPFIEVNGRVIVWNVCLDKNSSGYHLWGDGC